MDGGIAQLAVGIGADLLGRLPDQRLSAKNLLC